MKANECMCSNCRQVKTTGSFYKGVAGICMNRTLPICKECCGLLYERYTTIVNKEVAVWNILAQMNVPFIKSVWDSAILSAGISAGKNKKPPDYIATYLKKLSETEVVYQGFWESDSMANQLTNVKSQIMDNVNNLEAMQKKWGKYGDSDEVYVFLENTFNEYTQDVYDMDGNLSNRYKDLCIAEYAKRKAQESGDTSEIAKAQDMIAKQLKLLKLDDFKQSAKTEEEKRIERMAWMIENTRPAECEDLEKYKDYSGIEETWKDIKRCVINLVAGTKEYPNIPKDVL